MVDDEGEEERGTLEPLPRRRSRLLGTPRATHTPVWSHDRDQFSVESAGEFNLPDDEESQRESEADTESLLAGSEVSVDEMHVPPTETDPTVREPRVTSVEIRAALEDLDSVDLSAIFSRRACVMRTTPYFLRGPFRNALRLAMEEAIRPGEVHQSRGWKLFLLLPRLLLHGPPRGGTVHKSDLVERFDDFACGSWRKLLDAASMCDEDAATAHTRKRRQHQVGDVPRRAARALSLVQMGE